MQDDKTNDKDSQKKPVNDEDIPEALRNYYKRHELLKGLPVDVIKRAWFTMSHLVLPPGAVVADMGCASGTITYAMAALNPDITFVGVDIDRNIVKAAAKQYSLPNLTYKPGNSATGAGFGTGSLDAIVSSFTLHEIYSAARYDDYAVRKTLEKYFSLLKQDGLMFIRDYALPAQEAFVWIEMPDIETGSGDLSQMAEPELLLWYAENARRDSGESYYGFFLEEMPPRFPDTRLFRMPYKWAYEFIMRKDDRAHLEDELPTEYTFFTEQAFRKTLRSLGGRVLYSTPHWDQGLIKNKFEGHFHIYDDNGAPLEQPPTSFIAVIRKTTERQSLQITERRPSTEGADTITVSALRNEKTGELVDIVTRDQAVTSVIPYRVSSEGRLKIFLQDGVPRGIINAVPRKSRNLDGKQWSGHMTEAVSIPREIAEQAEKGEYKDVVRFARDWLGLKPAIDSVFEQGPSYYPAPDFIDEVIHTRYLRVAEQDHPGNPKRNFGDIVAGSTVMTKIREVDAQQVLDAISVGLIPDTRLETQILALFAKLRIQAEAWRDSPLALPEEDPVNVIDGPDLIRMLEEEEGPAFKETRGTAGQLRPVRSVFVDEGETTAGIGGLSAHDIDFVLSEDTTRNKALVLPLCKDTQGKAMMGFSVEMLPVPQRQDGGNGAMIRAPAFPLPREVTTMEQAKAYIAGIFEVEPDRVWKMGESYFCHSGITPQRIFPFVVASAGVLESPISGPVTYAPMSYIWDMFDYYIMYRMDCDILGLTSWCHHLLGDGSELGLTQRYEARERNYANRVPVINTLSVDGTPSPSPAPAQTTAPTPQASPSSPSTEKKKSNKKDPASTYYPKLELPTLTGEKPEPDGPKPK